MKNIYRHLFLVLFFLLILESVSAQSKRTNHWLFMDGWLDFNTGSPPSADTVPRPVPGRDNQCGAASDANGNLLFSSSSLQVFDTAFYLMANGDDIGSKEAFQGPLIFNKPGSERDYYIFNWGPGGTAVSLVYSLVDMDANSGWGAVIEKAVHLKSNVVFNVHGIHHANNEDVWVVCHENKTNKWFSYLVTAAGIDLTPSESVAGGPEDSYSDTYIKISPDGKYIAHTVSDYDFVHNPYQARVELLSFDRNTGLISDDGKIVIDIDSRFNNGDDTGMEFSPDCSKFYLSEYNRLYQYDLKAGDSLAIINSRYSYELDTSNTSLMRYVFGSLQLGPDGKIYNAAGQGSGELPNQSCKFLSVINKPNEAGVASDFQQNSLNLNGGNAGFLWSLPSFLADYLKDPVINANTYCAGQPVDFSIELNDVIDSIFWHFNDSYNTEGDTSSALSPSYIFNQPGIYDVTATIYFGNLTKTIPYRIEIFETPTPNLGNDTTFCANETINLTLDAGTGQTYNWNGNFNPGGQTYEVTAPGTYWVRVLNHGCAGRDTMNVVQYQPPVADVTGVAIGNATCGGLDGSIAGIVMSGPLYTRLEWQNSTGTVIGTGLDLTGMPAGIYSLYVYYGDDCVLAPISFEINNTAAPQITGITPVTDHCSLGFGELQVDVLPGPGSPYTYSLDGVNFTNSAGFTGLTAGDYTVTVMDVNGCTDAMPVTVPDTPGPQVTDSTSIPENGYAQNGMITIKATGDSVYYSLDGGTPQPGGTFSGLSAGDYPITVTDKWGCQRLVFMTVDRLLGVVLSAVAGNDYKCMNELAYSTLSADNFIDVKQYKAVLVYNNLMLRCIGYNPALGFADAIVTVYNGSVEIEWQSDVPVTLPGTVELTDLIFESTAWGVADIKWDTAWSVFRDGYGNIIASSLNPGIITINNPPLLQNNSPKTEFCEGEQALIEFNYTGGTEPVDIEWNTPDNATISGLSLPISSIKLDQAGNYTILANDANNCKDILNIPVMVYTKPTSGFEGYDTIWFEHSMDLTATQGYDSYQWSTGDTSYFITVTEEGKYSVLMETTEGCTALSEVTMATTIVPINIPNAFTPNGDGLNDTFKPVVNTELIRRYHLTIYNKWGQRLFETSDSGKGWDGENVMEGVYVWVIDYENRVGKAEQIKGSVSLIK